MPDKERCVNEFSFFILYLYKIIYVDYFIIRIIPPKLFYYYSIQLL